MYETGLQTDLVLVASDGTSFSIHKVTNSFKLPFPIKVVPVYIFVQSSLVFLTHCNLPFGFSHVMIHQLSFKVLAS